MNVITSVQVSGKLQDPDGEPIAQRKLRLFSGWSIFSTYKDITIWTEEDGSFCFRYPAAEKVETIKSVVLQLCDESDTPIAATRISFSRKADSHLGIIKLPFYPIGNDLPLEETGGESHLSLLDKNNIPFFAKLALAEVWPKLATFIAQNSVKEIQNALGEENRQLKSKDVIDMLMNGICPEHPEKGENEGELVYRIFWEGIDQDQSADLPDARFVVVEDIAGYTLKEVAIRYPGCDWEVRERGEQENYRRVLHLAASSAIVRGEAVYHLALGHLVSGFYTLAFLRHIDKNPIKQFLSPHLNIKTLRINQLGENLIFGDTGVLNQSGLSPLGIKQVMEKALSQVRYNDFAPRKPLGRSHRFAHLLQILWHDVALPAAHSFVQMHENEIAEHWREIYQFSETLVHKSVPFNPGKPKSYHDPRELNLNSEGMVQYKNQWRSFRPITDNPHIPHERDLKKLAKVMAHALLTSFWHYLLHSAQKNDVTNIKFATLAPHNQGFNAERTKRDHYAGTTAESAAAQLSVVHTLLHYKYERLMDNPEVDETLKLLLERCGPLLKDLGLDINDLMTCVEI